MPASQPVARRSSRFAALQAQNSGVDSHKPLMALSVFPLVGPFRGPKGRNCNATRLHTQAGYHGLGRGAFSFFGTFILAGILTGEKLQLTLGIPARNPTRHYFCQEVPESRLQHPHQLTHQVKLPCGPRFPDTPALLNPNIHSTSWALAPPSATSCSNLLTSTHVKVQASLDRFGVDWKLPD